MISSIIFALTEITFLFAGLLILHGLRKVIGSAPFYIAMGLLFVFMQFVGASALRVETGYPGLDFQISSSVLLLPFLASLMITYVSEGTLAAQRLIIGLMASLGIFLYLSESTVIQATASRVISGNESVQVLGSLLGRGLHAMASTVIAVTLDLFLIPIFYQKLRNIGCRLFLSVLGSLILVEIIDSIVFSTIFNFGRGHWWTEIENSYLAKAIFTVWLSMIASIYLARTTTKESHPGEGRRTLDILIAFFGTYGKAKALEEDLRRTEERYRKLVQYAADMIIVMDHAGNIREANPAAEKMTMRPLEGVNFTEITGIPVDEWSRFSPPPEHSLEETTGNIFELLQDETPYSADAVLLSGSDIRCDISISPLIIDGKKQLLVLGRDVTERWKLEQEQEEWRNQMSHSQRLESIGRLAGGIAHDFNNFLHSIQGHLDIIRYMHEVKDPEVERHLEKIDGISEKAAVLTRQLLGFARKGKYNETELDLTKLVESTVELFMPSSSALYCDIRVSSHPSILPHIVRGDLIQLQQTILNILFNARDAMREQPEARRRINIIIGNASDLGLQGEPPREVVPMEMSSYCAIRIQDTGPGISDAVKARIFEPFFTTKPVGQGTGMGLSMAYGTMISHKGWIQCENSPAGGAVFWLVIPNIAFMEVVENSMDSTNRMSGI